MGSPLSGTVYKMAVEAQPEEAEISIKYPVDETSGCHDGYDGVQTAASAIDRYTLEHWQSVEAFVYFGHRRAMVPPVSWINAGHRNGALVLGTFCCEGDYPDNGYILDKRSDGTTYMLADALARIAKCYRFDGWLINIETSDGKEPYLSKLLADGGTGVATLLKQLKSKLPTGSKVIWYDGAVNVDKDGGFQGTLTETNLAFAGPAGSIATDYGWNGDPTAFFKTATETAKGKLDLSDIYFGLECQGQRVPKFRETYRGGTATGQGVQLLAANGFGSGLFSIAWAYEDFTPEKQPPIAQQSPRVVDRFMWEGQSSLIPIIHGLTCRCTDGSITHLGSDNGVALSQSPIIKFARQYPAGSEGLFHTDYSDAMLQLAAGKYQAQIAQQSIFPAVRSSPMTSVSGNMTTQLSNSSSTPKCTIGVAIATDARTSGQINESLTLHYLNAKYDHGLQVSVSYQRLSALSGLNISLFALLDSATSPVAANQKTLATDTSKQTLSFAIACGVAGNRVTAVGIHISGPAALFTVASATNILDIFQLTIKPSTPTYPPNQQLSGLKLTRHTASTTYPGETPQAVTTYHRLVWTIPPGLVSPPTNWPTYLPWSPTTGPFSHFTITAGNAVLPGRAYALAYVINDSTFQGLTKSGNGAVSFTVNGHAFDGSLIGSVTGSVVSQTVA